MLGDLDIQWQVPERHRFGGRKTFAHLLGRETRLERISRDVVRRRVGRINPRLGQLPDTLAQHGGARLDSLQEVAGRIVRKYRHAAELNALIGARLGVDDGLTVIVDLAHPEAVAVALHPRLGATAQVADLEPRGSLLQRGGERVVDEGREHAEDERDEDRRRDELPGRDAGRARDHELEPARQVEIAGHAGDQDRERHDALGDLRHAKERRLGDDQRRNVGQVGGLAHQLDVLDERDQREDPEEDEDRGDEEAQAEVATERADGQRAAQESRRSASEGGIRHGAGHGAGPHVVANRRDRRSVTACTARTRKAGGSMIVACEIASRQSAVAANTATYWKVSATGYLIPSTMLAKPIRRSVATAPTAEMSDQVRLCRVVRGAPRYAKAMITKAIG